MRSVDEWIGKTDDAKIPDRVKLRVFQKYGARCYLSGVPLRVGDWDIDHIIPLADGGEHRESNLAPVWRPKHREKTKQEATDRAKVRQKASKHIGIKRQKKKIPSRGFHGWQPRVKDINEL